MTIGEVCNREVVWIGRDASVTEAARLMRRLHVGDVVVTEERGGVRMPVGILTDRDIVVALVAAEAPPEALAVGDVMTCELLTAGEQDSVSETIQRMRARGVRRVPVVGADGALVGILAVDDLIDLIAEQLVDLVKLIGTEQQRERQKRG